MTAPAEAVTDAGPPRPSRALEIVVALGALALCTTYFVLANQIVLRREAVGGQMDARTWPMVLGAAGVAVAIALLVIALTRPPASREDVESASRGGAIRIVLTLVLSAAFIALWSVSSVIAFGFRIRLFPIAAAIYLLLLLLLYGQRRWPGLVIYPVALTAFIYALFGMLLRIPL